MGNKQTSQHQSSTEDQGHGQSDEINALRLKQVFQGLVGEDNTDGSQGQCTLDRQKFKSLFPLCPAFGDIIFNHMTRVPPSGDEGNLPPDGGTELLTINQFVRQGSLVISLIDRTRQLEYFFPIFTNGEQQLTKSDGICWLREACIASWACLGININNDLSPKDDILSAMLKTMFDKEESVDWHTVKYYCGMHCGNMCQGLQVYAAMAFLGHHSQEKSSKSSPQIMELIQSRRSLFGYSLLWALSATLQYGYFPTGGIADLPEGTTALADCCFSLPLESVVTFGSWHQLYNSNDQGLSVNRFQNHVFHYKGSSVVLVTFEGHIYCVATDEEWRDSGHRWGGVETCLLEILPQYKVLQGGAPMIYLNMTQRTIPRCLQVGKSPQTTVLEIDADFSKIKQFGLDHSLHIVEAWGCAGNTAKEAQAKQKQWEQKEAEKAKFRKLKMDKDEWQDSPDRQILDMGGVKTEHAER